MGRPERPLDPAAGPVQRLAQELRELREAAGRPTYRQMASQAHFSVAALAQAAAGKKLPSLDVLQGYVRACGGEPGEWEPRWKAAEAEVVGQARDEPDVAPPYRGLARYEPGDRDVFFGRDRLIEDVGSLVCERRFAVVFGASGSGKSSLLRAGLVPRLRAEIARREQPAVLRVLTPGARPVASYGHLLAPGEGEPESWVVVDQFEEVFTLCRDRLERDRFIDLLLTARDPGSRLRVLIALRADFYGRCAEHRELAEALRGAGLLVGPMTADELRDVVVKPAQAAGLIVERELTARIVDEVLDEPGGLPMLSHALLETWRRRRSRMLSLAAYETTGGVRGAIAATAETAYGALNPEQARAARQLLLRMVEPGQGTPDTRRPLPRAELDAWTDSGVGVAVETLTRARLLTGDEDGVHLAHEALISCWPRLRDWIEEDRERLRHHRALTEDARVWLEHDRDPGTLYQGTRLARAQEMFPHHADDLALTATERAFLAAAVAHREAEHQAAVRGARRARILLSTLSAVLAVALAAGLLAWQQHHDNEKRRTDDAARRIAEAADSLRTTDPRTAQLLGVAAWRLARLPETRRALIGSLTQPETDTFTDPAPGDDTARLLTDSGRTLLSIHGGTWHTWDVADGTHTASGRLPDGQVLSAAPDGGLLVVQAADGRTRLWDLATGKWTGPVLPAATTVDAVAGGVLVQDDVSNGWIRLRSVTDGRQPFAIRVISQADTALAADGRTLAVCPNGQAPEIYDVARHRALPGDWQKAAGACDDTHAEFGFGGSRFSAVRGDGVRVWDVVTGREIARLTAPGTQDAALSADGAFLATLDPNEIKVWRLSRPSAPVFRHSLNDQFVYDRLAWDSHTPRLRYIEGGTVHTLDLTAATTPAWLARPLDTALLSPDGRTLATAEHTGTAYRVRLRDTHDGSARTLPAPPLPVGLDPAAPPGPSETMPLLAFSSDGSALAYGVAVPGRDAAAQRVTVWDRAHDRVRTFLDLTAPAPAGAVTGLALGPGGHTLYAVRAPRVGNPRSEAWDIGRRRRTSVFPAADGTHLALRPDGRLLASDARTVRLPSGTVGAPDLTLAVGVAASAFAPDGSRLAVGDQGGRVYLWDGDARQRAGVLRNEFPTALGDDSEQIDALAFSPDGTTLAVGSDAGTLQLWDIATRQPLGGPLPTPGEAITSLAFAPDNTTLYASGAHVPLQRYDIDPAHALARICARTADADLTRDQWRTYAPDAPYRGVCGDRP
ncbi:WD40 repeat domain-containing protein [Streptomyces sp. NPDC004539]|uniref:WD40 repeat domain-containing protein n=1 Tax=Streptomyces sp. NPDC004539 TaxID=3154280 RepID=UPI0033ADE95B